MTLMPEFERDLLAAGERWHAPGARARRGARRLATAGATFAVICAAVLGAAALVRSPVDTEEPAVAPRPALPPPDQAVQRMLDELAPQSRPTLLTARQRRALPADVGLEPARAVTIPAPDGGRWLVVPGRRGFCFGVLATARFLACAPLSAFFLGGMVQLAPRFTSDVASFSSVTADDLTEVATLDVDSGRAERVTPAPANALTVRVPRRDLRGRVLVRRRADGSIPAFDYARTVAPTAFGVLRTPPASDGPRARRLRAIVGVTGPRRGVELHRAATRDDRRSFVAVVGADVCLLVEQGSGGASGCAPVESAVDPRTPMAVTASSREGRTVAVLVPDGASGARVRDSRGTRDVPIERNVVLARVRGEATVILTTPQGRVTVRT